MTLPSDFITRMRTFLGEEAGSLFAALQNPPLTGLRVNTLKINPDTFRVLCGWNLSPTLFSPSGFVLEEGVAAGKHPFHAAGLYYLQEPSAMVVAEVLCPAPGERVLDLCAAPGGKSTHIAAQMGGAGVLVSNEIERNRVGGLLSNLERCGVTQSIVTNETPERLARAWGGWFDRVLVDAPCSGEGMFRKGDEAARHYSPANITGCAVRQRQLLATAADLVRPGGTMVYSTCTFAPEEDEQTVSTFLRTRSDYDILPIPATTGGESGRPEWAYGDPKVAQTLRLWPHRVRGEGHFIALFRRREDVPPVVTASVAPPSAPVESVRVWEEFAKTVLSEEVADRFAGRIARYGENLYAVPPVVPPLDGLNVPRCGVWLGSVPKNRFEPSHSLALALHAGEVSDFINFAPDDVRLAAYLRGETWEEIGDSGWVLLCVAGFPIGWGKRSQNILKNHYPKGLRRPS